MNRPNRATGDLIGRRVGTLDRLQGANVDFPVYLTVPSSGASLATMACPIDPSDAEWPRASAIVCQIIGKRLGDIRLWVRELVCATANETIAAADVTDDPTQSAG